MAVHGKNTLVMIDENDLSAYFNDVGWSADIDAAETTTFSSGGAKTYIAGLGDGKISASGIFDGTAVTGSDARLAAAFANTDNSVLLTSPQGSVLGAQCKLAAGLSTTYEVASKVSDVVETKAEFQANGGVDSGQILAAARSVATATTTNETSVDRGASTANGGVAQLHVTANAANDATVIKVQHSANNSTWADLATFASVPTTDTLAERVVVAAGTTVNRYLRATSTTAGTGAVVYTVAFARR